ncbi:MAG: DUF4013 domain-containing protein, partial [Chloroflexi bacterium]|nr:DUF4013 domain-containing protein [Chloroflexota bacterium]
VGRGEARPMPDWSDLGGLFVDGLWLGIARFVLILPALILIFIPIFGLIFAGLLSDQLNSRQVGSALGAVTLIGFALSCGLAVLYGLAIGFILPAIAANYARHGTLASCLDIGAIVRFIRENLNQYLTAWLAGLLAGFAFSAVVSVVNFIPCIGTLLLIPLAGLGGFWIFMVTGHAIGQVLAMDSARHDAAVPEVKPA